MPSLRQWITRSRKAMYKMPQSLQKWCDEKFVKSYWMRLGRLAQYESRPLVLEKFPKPQLAVSDLPIIGITTPSFCQADFIERTMLSVLNQNYPKLLYSVFDGGSTDGTDEILKKYSDRLTFWKSEKDKGQSDAVRKGLTAIPSANILAWLNSDDVLMPGALSFIGEYFTRHPQIDAIYGHRVLIDEQDQEIGRWVLPPHHPEYLRWFDYVPQETLFFRRSLYEKVGGIDPEFRFALDWDLLLRFQRSGAKIVRVPYFLGCFRVHEAQKTQAQISEVGRSEMAKILQQEHHREITKEDIKPYRIRARTMGVIYCRLLEMGIRW